MHVDSAALLESLLPMSAYASATPTMLGPQALLEVLGEELLGSLIGVPAGLIAQAAAEGRTADRLECIGQVVWHLHGTYNNAGSGDGSAGLGRNLMGKVRISAHRGRHFRLIVDGISA